MEKAALMLLYNVITEHCNPSTAAVFLELSDRGLLTIYPWISHDKPLKTLTWFAREYGDRHVIVDSGLFTIIRDIVKFSDTEVWEPERFDEYFERYKRLLAMMPEHWTFIELDAHAFRELPVSVVEPYREWMEANGYSDRVLHVWHVHEGSRAFDEYVRRFKRVACSMREIGYYGMDPAQMHRLIRRNWSVIEDRGVHVHILGTSDDELFMRYPDCMSCDSSTWNSVAVYGETKIDNNWIRYDNQRKRLTAPVFVQRAVNNVMPKLIARYYQHPEFKRRKKVRDHYLRQLAAGFVAYEDHFNRLRRRSAKSSEGIGDPMEHWTDGKK